MNVRKVLILSLSLAVAIAAACGSGSTASSPTPDSSAVTRQLSDSEAIAAVQSHLESKKYTIQSAEGSNRVRKITRNCLKRLEEDGADWSVYSKHPNNLVVTAKLNREWFSMRLVQWEVVPGTLEVKSISPQSPC